jgi:hypothetical protein
LREAPFRLDIAQQLKAAGTDAYKQVRGLLHCLSLLDVVAACSMMLLFEV